ncbi:Gfo/Idh/MocA family oxidoreductase [Novipirellula caenicola]|uniref:D-apiose dehydrogenase n=1 Tax=Novipirellula caenicola TaxID=1536901 RepID=A0ABP9VHI7_9BACT
MPLPPSSAANQRTPARSIETRPTETIQSVNTNKSASMSRRCFAASTAAALAAMPLRVHANDSKRWRVGVIGHTGRGDFGHGIDTVWLGLPETEIVAVADADPQGREKAKQRLRCEHAFADYRELIEKTQPEIVAVGPRHVDQHHAMIMAAIEGGAKGVYCEKPFCATLEQADQIVAACERSGTRLAIAHRNRYHPALPVTKTLIEQGVIGRVLEIRCRGKEDARGGGQDLWVLGTHLLNIAVYFAGNPIACSATFYAGDRPATSKDVRPGSEGIGPIAGDRLHARYETQGGTPVFFDSIQAAGVAKAGFGIQIIGTEGVIDLRMDTEPLVHLLQGSPFKPAPTPRRWVNISSGGIGKPEPIADIKRLVSKHELPARDLIASINESRQPLCSDTDGRVTMEMVHATFASHVQQSARVSLPLTTRTHAFVDWKND